MICYFSTEELLLIHSMVIDETGGSHGVRDTHAILMLENLPTQSAFGKELYPTIFVKSALYARTILASHPFIDGNGRTARILSTLILYKTGYDFKRLFTISEYYDKNRPSYYQAIQSVRQSSMDMTVWLEYFVEDLRAQMEEIQEKGKKIIVADKMVKMLQDTGLNMRQEKIIRYLIINDRIDNEQCQKLCKSIKRTATRDLTSLVEKNVLEKQGEKKGTFYVLSPKIAEKIRDIKGHG